ncbi:MAG: hypothetical protein KDD62_07800, partial [Bdellovibrionales bacterium]|nr:hypothetical protein [Bdellovibrionales bacterium]
MSNTAVRVNKTSLIEKGELASQDVAESGLSLERSGVETSKVFDSKLWVQLTSILAANFLISKLWLSLPYFAEIRPQLYIVSGIIFSAFSLVALIISQAGLFRSALSSLRSARLEASILEVLAILVGSGLLILQWAQGSWEDLFFANQIIVLSLFLLCLEQHFCRMYDGSLRKITDTDLLARASLVEVFGSSSSGEIDRQAGTKLLNPGELKAGQVYQREGGNIIPADSIVLVGVAEVLERTLSGRGVLRVKNAGAPVFAGSEVVRGTLLLRVERALEDSVFSTCQVHMNQVFRESDLDREAVKKKTALPALGILFVALFVSIYWFRAGLQISQILPITASILFLGTALRMLRIVPDLYRVTTSNLFFSGFLPPLHAQWKSLVGRSRAVLLLDSSEKLNSVSVVEVQLLDDRVSEEQIGAILYAMASKTNRSIDAALTEFICQEQESIELFDAQSFGEYGSKGLCAAI